MIKEQEVELNINQFLSLKLIGAKRIAFLNLTPGCDISKSISSYNCIKKVVEYFKEI